MKHYSVHNLLSIDIASGLENSNRFLDFLETVTETNPENGKAAKIIITKVRSFDLSRHREYADGIFISPLSLIDLKYGIEVSAQGDTIYLKTKFRFIEWLIYCIQLSLLKIDATLIHGAAVSKNGQAILFPSWGGVGKTAILNVFVKKHGYKVLGDDLFILNKEGIVLPFPKAMVLYPYHRNLFPEIFRGSAVMVPIALNKLVSKLVPKVKKLLSPFPRLMNYVRNRNPQVKWVLPFEVFGEDSICKESTVTKAFWLERSFTESKLELENKNIYSQIIGSTINEFDQRVIFSVNVLMGLKLLSYESYLGKWYEVLTEGLSKSGVGQIDISKNVAIEDIGDFMHRILNDYSK